MLSKPGEPLLQSPMFEFVTAKEEKIRTGRRTYSSTLSVKVGENITVAYNPLNPENVQILKLMEFPLIPLGFVLGFILFILLIWIS